MPTLKQPNAFAIAEEFVSVGLASEAVAEGDVAAGDATSTLSYDASAGKVEVLRAAGAIMKLDSFTELVSIAAAASTMTTASMPAYAMPFAASVYVVAAIPGTSSFAVTLEHAGHNLAYGGSVNSSAGSSNAGNAGCPVIPVNASAQKIVLTPDVVPSAGTGQVRVAVYWVLPVAPTG